MAMTIMNNSSTAMSLGELNKNINKIGKSLSKLSSGKRIMNASEDAASFAISEKMREQIRSLEQDIQNVQNGTSMLKTAHAGIENIVEELRSLKELAINSANDSNTDDDRKIIQKEFDQRRATIDEIASWTNYNTKPLLDGTYRNVSRTFDIEASSNRSKNEYSAGFDVGSPNCSETLNTFLLQAEELKQTKLFKVVTVKKLKNGKTHLSTKNLLGMMEALTKMVIQLKVLSLVFTMILPLKWILVLLILNTH